MEKLLKNGIDEDSKNISLSRRRLLKLGIGLSGAYLLGKLYGDDFIGVAEAKNIRYDPNFWYENGRDGDFTFHWLDASKKGPPNEECWEAYKRGWYDRVFKKNKPITYEEFERILPILMIPTMENTNNGDIWPPKNIINYNPKVILTLSNIVPDRTIMAKKGRDFRWLWLILAIIFFWPLAIVYYFTRPKNTISISLEENNGRCRVSIVSTGRKGEAMMNTLRNFLA